MEMRPYDAAGPAADMSALNAPAPEEAIAAEAEIVRERGSRLDAYTRALDANAEAMRGLEEGVRALMRECGEQRAAARDATESALRDIEGLRDEVGALCGDATDRALEVGERIARRHFSWMSDAIREQDLAMAEGARAAAESVERAADRAAARVGAASSAATSAIDRSKIDAGKVMGEMRRQYLSKLVVVPAAVVVMVVYLTVLTWRVWPALSGRTMTDLDAANLRIEQLSAELDAYKSTGAALGDERQAALDERLRELQDAYDASRGAGAPSGE